ncbi:MAG: PhnD/SsuA/transferrin family substrate-binding protein [Bacteroidales bacterium]|nr:PhnD/SsuA/transferrin family substrate-binding protein [Bacteroidales bacterium]
MKKGWFYLLLYVLTNVGCTNRNENSGPRYSTSPGVPGVPVYCFAVHPLHNPNKLLQVYQPLIDYLNVNVTGARFTIEASRDYASYEKKYLDRKPGFLLPNPWQTIQAMKVGYHVLAMAGEPGDFKGIFVVRKDGGIRSPSDLKGKVISYPASTALAACIMPQYFLHSAGINVSTGIINKYVGSQESSIMNVFLGQSVAGATWPPPWRAFQKDHPKEAAALMVIWETEPLINNSVMVRDDVPDEIRLQVQKLLTTLNEKVEGKPILSDMETSRFILATDKDYDIVGSYIKRFENEVRKIETK